MGHLLQEHYMSNSNPWFVALSLEDVDDIKYIPHPIQMTDEDVEETLFDETFVKNAPEIPLRVIDGQRSIVWYYFLNEDAAQLFADGMRTGVGAGQDPRGYWENITSQANDQL